MRRFIQNVRANRQSENELRAHYLGAGRSIPGVPEGCSCYILPKIQIEKLKEGRPVPKTSQMIEVSPYLYIDQRLTRIDSSL